MPKAKKGKEEKSLKRVQKLKSKLHQSQILHQKVKIGWEGKALALPFLGQGGKSGHPLVARKATR